ncbi:hypothetical protein [Cellulomonas fimi]|uniref:Glycosyl hydrolase 36 catalytic domain-containing protein n=1 Tax=Cellulomonas fimi TaxID=1708 RepID=A0A7Y0LZC9_CELFI|nr:hypothetical protein [Cellulomonas fimi]NMR20691.1 hypothetical protein [Cellulomonas fimi]
MNAAPDAPPWRLEGGGGLRALVVDGGALASLAADDVELVQHAASALEPGLVQVWVRDRESGRCWPVLGAGSVSRVTVHDGALVVTGSEDPGAQGDGAADDGGGLRWRVSLALHAERPAWSWRVEVRNAGGAPREVDVVHTHDVALAASGMLRTNELYVSQYLDVTPLDGPTGTALAVRQNLPQSGRHPWCVLAADVPVASWASDALDVHGSSGRWGGATGPTDDLPGRRRQHEHTLAALQTERTVLAPGEGLGMTFAGLLLADHAAATSDADQRYVREALDLGAAKGPARPAQRRAAELGRRAPSGAYDQGRELRVREPEASELTDRWPEPWSVVERDEAGAVLSFFAGPEDDPGREHVVVQAKEREVLRPHGTILRTGARAVPDPEGLTATAWMAGSPLSYLTRGNATTGRVLTTVRGYLGLQRAYGLRLLVEVAGRWRLLDLPSAFAMTPDSARWEYLLDPADGGGTVEVRTIAPAEDHRVTLRVGLTGPRRRVLVALHLATPSEPLPEPEGPTGQTRAHTREPRRVEVVVPGVDGVERVLAVAASAPLEPGDDGPLFDDGAHRVPGVVTLRTDEVSALELTLTVDVAPDLSPAGQAPPDSLPGSPGTGWWEQMTALRVSGDGEDLDALTVSLPWLVRDALVHFLSPRGLEQYSGGAWGTRDVTQGPLELLLALDRLADARALLLGVFAAQNVDGSWPQAFGFLPGDEHFRMEPAHGDVAHWPVLALGRYLLASQDADVLDEPVPWYTPDGPGAPTSLLDHVERALELARRSTLPSTGLAAYGHGDWNDSLQPADPAMARTMTSAWTVTLHHQALRTLAAGLAAAGLAAAGLAAAGHTARRVHDLRTWADAVEADLQRYLVIDGELAGYVQLGELGKDEGKGEGGDEGEGEDDVAVPVRRVLVHPRDTETGLRHGSLQIIHALGDELLDPGQVQRHLEIVRGHLMGVDGVRLFDQPPGYHGGETRHFQRAETATFVGREIGLMYAHAHLRWCEAMAHLGDADALWLGLRQVLAPGVLDVVPGARRRQANTYSSSSDAAVLDRPDFAARYAEVLTGATGLEGGWRIYSSGPGVLVRVITQSLLGVRRRGPRVEIDPVLPAGLDGVRATVPLAGGNLRLRYHVGPQGFGVGRLRLAEREVLGVPGRNGYRDGGLSVPLSRLAEALAPGGPELEVDLL